MHTPTTVDQTTELPGIDELREIELRVLTGYTLADAIRDGASKTTQAFGRWRSGNSACTLAAAYIGASSRGYVA